MKTMLRSALALVATTAAFALPATASAMTSNISEANVSAWAGTSATAVNVSFAPHYSWGFPDKIDANDGSAVHSVTGDTGAFSVALTNCTAGTSSANCTVAVTFNAPAAPEKPMYSVTVRVFSDWHGAAYDGVVTVTGFAGIKGTNGTNGTNGGNGQNGATGPKGPGCYVPGSSNDPNTVPVELPNVNLLAISMNPDLVPCEKGDKGDKGDTGATGATGSTGATGAAGIDAPASAALVVTKVKIYTVRSSCMVKRNFKKARVAYCLVKVPKGTPKAKWELLAGGSRIATGSVKGGVRTFRVTKVLPKTVGGWITVKLTNK